MKVTKVQPVVATPKVVSRLPRKNPYVFDPKTDKGRINQYFSNVDPAVIVHSNKTHRTVSEAFRDADYATPIWRCESDWDRTKGYLGWIILWAFFLFMLYTFAIGFEKWIAS